MKLTVCEPVRTKLEKYHLTEFMAMNTSKSHTIFIFRQHYKNVRITAEFRKWNKCLIYDPIAYYKT